MFLLSVPDCLELLDYAWRDCDGGLGKTEDTYKLTLEIFDLTYRSRTLMFKNPLKNLVPILFKSCSNVVQISLLPCRLPCLR